MVAGTQGLPPDDKTKPFSWLLQMGDSLDEYQFRWIAVDPGKIETNWNLVKEIIVADGDTLGDVMQVVEAKGRDPVSLFYVFIRPQLTSPSRQTGV